MVCIRAEGYALVHWSVRSLYHTVRHSGDCTAMGSGDCTVRCSAHRVEGGMVHAGYVEYARSFFARVLVNHWCQNHFHNLCLLMSTNE